MSELDIRGIRKRYGQLETLNGIDISLVSGEFLVLLGSSGCGKSTLLNIIAGLAEPNEGDVLIDGRSIMGMHPKDRDIAMVFQSYALYPNLTVARNIGFGLEMRKVPAREREIMVGKTAQLLQIENLLDRKPGQLSGGQRQRVAIGRALVRNPKIFLFDEPLSNLDARLRLEMRTELKRLHQLLKTTVVYVTHDQIEAMTLATRIAVMRNGRIEQLGTPSDIYNRPATLYVAGFVGSPSMNFFDATVENGGLRISGSNHLLPVLGRVVHLAAGRSVKLGVRPEAFGIGPVRDGKLTVPVTVELLEFTGPELVASCRIGSQTLLARLPPNAKVDVGEDCVFSIDPNAIRLFDVETELSL